MALAVQAQVIDPLTGSLAGYTTTPVLDNSLGAGQGVSFTSSGSGLQNNYVGTGTTPEQTLFLAPAASFSTTFAVGDRLTVDVAVPNGPQSGAVTEDFGLAISATGPVAASAGNSWNSRTLFDWASVSVRPPQSSIRANTSISGTLTTSSGVLTGVGSSTVSKLFIDWTSVNSFTLGYIDAGTVQHISETVTFAGSSTIGTQIGFYGDLRATSEILGFFNNLTISTIPVPEPSAMAFGGLGSFLGLAGWLRRKK